MDDLHVNYKLHYFKARAQTASFLLLFDKKHNAIQMYLRIVMY